MASRVRYFKNTKSGTIRAGFMALTDAAPLVMAQELGLFEKQGLRVVLSRQVGWATVRERVIHGELDAAHAPAGMIVAASAGLGSARVACLTGMFLSLHGNAITLSQRLWKQGIRNGHDLREYTRSSGTRPVFASVYRWSSHTVLLRHWLKQHGMEPGRDVELLIVPPSQMVSHLRAGNLDGFCAGEPWNSLAVLSRAGWVVAHSAELMPGHPEKALLVRETFAQERPEEHAALLAALIEACAWCDAPENREEMARVLECSEIVGAPRDALLNGMRGSFDFGNGRIEPCAGFNIFSRKDANVPDAGKANWVVDQVALLAANDSMLVERAALVKRCFRRDLYAAALARTPLSLRRAA